MLAATMRLVDAPQATALAVLGYPDMGTAAEAVPGLLPHAPLAVEGIDGQLVEVVGAARRLGDLHQGYTPGVGTAPTIVAPFSIWACRMLRRAPGADRAAADHSTLLGPLVILGVHAVASALLRARGRLERRRRRP